MFYWGFSKHPKELEYIHYDRYRCDKVLESLDNKLEELKIRMEKAGVIYDNAEILRLKR